MPILDLPPKLWTPPAPAIIRPAERELLRSARLTDKRERAGLVPLMPIYVPAVPVYATRINVTNAGVASSTSTPNFGTLALGTPVGTSLVVVVIHAWNGGTNGTALSSVTIDGSAATIHQNQLSGVLVGHYTISAIASRATSNTTGGISAAFTQNMDKMYVEIYRLINLTSATPDNSAKVGTNNGTTVNTNVAVTSPGIVIAGGAARSGTATVMTISGVSQDDNGEFLTHGMQYVSGSDHNQPTNASRNISVTTNEAGASVTLVMASWH